MKLAATIGIAAAVLFIPSFLLGAHPHGFADIVNGISMICGTVGFAILYFFGYRPARAGGPGRFAAVSFGLLALGHLFIVGGALLLSALGIDDNSNNPATLVFPLGGLLILVFGFIAAIKVVRARVLPGRGRWALLGTAIAYVISMAAGIAGGDHAGYLLNAVGVVWPISVLFTAAALRSAPAAALAPEPDAALAHV